MNTELNTKTNADAKTESSLAPITTPIARDTGSPGAQLALNPPELASSNPQSESDDSSAAPAPSKPRRPRRRMRRSSRPCGKARAKSSRRTRAPKNPSSSTGNHRSSPARRYKSTPFEPLPEFAALSPDQIEYIHDYLRHATYEQSISFLRQDFGIEISLNRLYRYRSRLDLAEQLHIASDNSPAIENLLALLAGRSVDIDAAGLHAIKQRALSLASRPDTAPSLLMNLFRIFTWEHRKTVDQHRMKCADRREKCRERMTKVAEQRHKLAVKNFKKLNPKEISMREQEEALINLFGDFPPVKPFAGPIQDPTGLTDPTGGFSSDVPMKSDSQFPGPNLDSEP